MNCPTRSQHARAYVVGVRRKSARRQGRSCARAWRALLRGAARLAREQDGQATLEYVILLSVVVVAAAGIARAIIEATDRGILVFGGALEKSLKTGRATLNVWTN